MSADFPRKRVLRPDAVWDPNAAGFAHAQPFSQGIETSAGRLVFVAGQVALDIDGNVIGIDDPAKQTEAALENMKLVLAEAGATLDDVLKLTVFMTQMRHFPAIQEVRARYFPKNPPASTTLAITALVNPDLLVEIDAIAVVPE